MTEQVIVQSMQHGNSVFMMPKI